MRHIELIDDLSIKKLDPKDEIDLWLVRLDSEYSEFFYSIESYFYHGRYSN